MDVCSTAFLAMLRVTGKFPSGYLRRKSWRKPEKPPRLFRPPEDLFSPSLLALMDVRDKLSRTFRDKGVWYVVIGPVANRLTTGGWGW